MSKKKLSKLLALYLPYWFNQKSMVFNQSLS